MSLIKGSGNFIFFSCARWRLLIIIVLVKTVQPTQSVKKKKEKLKIDEILCWQIFGEILFLYNIGEFVNWVLICLKNSMGAIPQNFKNVNYSSAQLLLRCLFYRNYSHSAQRRAQRCSPLHLTWEGISGPAAVIIKGANVKYILVDSHLGKWQTF